MDTLPDGRLRQHVPGIGEAPAGDWTGVWEGTFALFGGGTFHITMVFDQVGDHVTGSYDWEDGLIEGDVSGSTLTGMWYEGPSYEPPKDAGAIELTIAADGDSFTGLWKYADSEGWVGPWDGVRAD